jgi:protein SCO1/2
MRLDSFTVLAFLLASLVSVPPGHAAPSGDTVLPPVMREVDIDEHLGAQLDLGLALTDEAGKRVVLGDYFRDGKPVVLTLAYFRCPMLCGLVLHGLVSAFGRFDWRLGEQYRALTVSFDPKDRPNEAAAKQATTMLSLRPPGNARDWPFLVGEPEQIRVLTETLGFRFAYDARTDQYAHPAVAFVVTPDGRVSRYLYGTDFAPRDLRLALLEAGSGKVGTIVDRILLTCYRFDPATRRYGPFIRGFMRVGGGFILLAVTLTVALLFRAERRRLPIDRAR